MFQEDNFFSCLNIKMNKKVVVIVGILIIVIIVAVVSFLIMSSSTPTTQASPKPVAPLTPTISVPQSSDPCSGYNDTDKNISDVCITKLWKDGGCPSDGIRQIAYYKNNKAVMTKLQISNDAKAWAILNDIDHRTDCYGIDKSKWPAPLPAPFSKGTLSITPWNSEGGGDVYFLDRHSINCDNKPINRFKLVRKGDGNMAYEYNCSEGGILKSPTTYSNPPSEANSNTVYLDRQPINCDKNSLLSRMQLAISPDKTWKYNYSCVKSEKELSCRDVSTGWNEEGGGNALYLDRHDVKCENDESLSSIALVRKGDGNYRYNYKCCKSTPAPASEPFSFITSVPQYLRHLQNKNYLLY
jgi:hypothetical protein